MRPVGILNSPRITVPGRYQVDVISPRDFKAMVDEQGLDSYVRHEGASFVLGDLLRQAVPLGTGRFEWEEGDTAVAMDLYKPRGMGDLSAADIRRLHWRLLRIKRVW